jgi:hypothetical protein
MKHCVIALVFLLTVSFSAGVTIAGPPLDGTYKSTDIGGVISIGHYSESFTVPNGATSIGTTLNAQSWDGANLGNEWSYSCATIITAPVILTDTVDPVTGTGNRTYMKTFIGGSIWLSGTGPWGNGDSGYAGPIDNYVEFETVQYVEFERVHAVTNVQAQAHFNGYPGTCLAFSVANGLEIGSTDFGDVRPSSYPELIAQTTCTPGVAYGAWWDMTDLSLVISGCSVPSEDHTWGSVKQLYK